MYISLFDIWRRFLVNLGFLPPGRQGNTLKGPQIYQTRVKASEFDSSKQVRILLFRELNGQDRRLLFDSKAVRKKDPSASPGGKFEKPSVHLRSRKNQESSIEKSFKLNDSQSKDFIYEWQKSSSDEQMLREMIFGSVSISYQGTTLKVHTIRSPSQIMLSVVFPAPPVTTFRIGEQENEESGNWNSSVGEININKSSEKLETHLAHSVPVNVPSRLSGHFDESRDSDSDSLQSHEGYNSLPTTHLTPETSTACLPRSSSYNSLQRRLLRNKATSIELGLQKPDDGTNEEYPRSSGQKRVKLGLSVVINLNENDKQEEKHFSHFLFSHISLIEGHLMSLKDTVVKAYLNRRSFVHLMFEGSRQFQQALNDLYTAPRLQNPEWLTIISSPNHRHLSYSFLEKFSAILKQYDKKETHFFVSTILTAVLTYHLAWVPSVIPTDSKIQSTQTSHKYTPFWVDLLAKSRPYNPHWVQLSDLYGALGIPLKLSKTVVKGQKKEIVLQFLQVLSYFIRCSDICEQLYERTDGLVITDKNLRFPNETKASSVDTSNISSKLNSSQSNLSTPVGSCDLPSVSIQSLPKNLDSPNSALLSSHDVDTASDSSKDNCDVVITPTEGRTSDSSVNVNSNTVTDSCLVPNVSEISCSLNNGKDSRDSLGYMSLEDKLECSETSRKRLALSEQHANCCQELPCTVLDINSSIKDGKENNPVINVTCTDNCDNATCCSEICRSAKSKTCCCKSCLCYANRSNDSSCTKDLNFDSSKVKECESVEEGYHSMEEPHSPSRAKMHLSEMLKHFDNWCPEGLEEIHLPELIPSSENISPSPYKSFGWSLIAGITDHYLMDFCLQGLCGSLCEKEIRDDLARLTHIHVLGEQVSEAVCIVADTDTW
ncbi:folliculin-interacting protein 2-like isoform X1 [Stegodyphus dumicola]|uniref:folliculin-interacting protein 2-like isoform X1 n=2 Tax=Stegodyphus dumicola TaxID=202533 RepID=UPI0015AE6128|nr:folliculin-interacting protein 2-like isoform X1 [Stegodyphus dumicola]